MNRTISTLVLTVASVAAMTGAACAQSNLHLRANVPFSFTAEGKHFEAGPYEVTQVEESVLELRNVEDGKVVIARVSEGRKEAGSADKNVLVFHRYAGGDYFLAQIARSHHAEAMTLGTSGAEKEMAKQEPKRPEIIVVSVDGVTSEASGK